MDYKLSNPFSVCFSIMKIRYQEFDQTFNDLSMITPRDSVNVFINLETILGYLSNLQDIDRKLVGEPKFPTILTSEILNLAAHYKRFFRDNKLPTRIFLYMTDLDSDNFKEFEINEDYRSYYLTKYNGNPKYDLLTGKLKSYILPTASKIAEFLPDVHLILSKNTDASLVPYIISEHFKTDKNIIITGDMFDTQYIYKNNFCVHYLRRSPMYKSLSYTIDGYLKEIFKRQPDETSESQLFKNGSLYTTMLSVIGEKYRSIETIRRIGALTVVKLLQASIREKQIQSGTKSIELIKEAFPVDAREELVDNYHLFSLDKKYMDLTESDKFQILHQIVNRSDKNSLLKLNDTSFYEYKIMLEELTM